MTLETRARGRSCGFTLRLEDLARVEDIEQLDIAFRSEPCDAGLHGTTITLTGLHQGLAYPDANKLRQVLLQDYGRQDDFHITVDGKQLDVDDVSGNVVVAKNYVTEAEMAQLQRLVSAYLDLAEDMALRQIPMTMQDWETRLNRFIEATDREVLQDAGKVTAEIAWAHAESEFEKYRIVQDRRFESDFDRAVKQIEAGSKPTDRDE